MTKAHFEAIAKILKAQRDTEAHNFFERGACDPGHLVVDRIAEDLADQFATVNPRFDRARFLTACGTPD